MHCGLGSLAFPSPALHEAQGPDFRVFSQGTAQKKGAGEGFPALTLIGVTVPVPS